jgi:hypothetical protein
MSRERFVSPVAHARFSAIQDAVAYVKAASWGMPFVGVDAMRQACFRDPGAKYNDIIYFSKPADWRPAPAPAPDTGTSTGRRSRSGTKCLGPKGAGGLSPGFQPGFNPGNRHPGRFALKGRQIQRTNNLKAESNCCTSRLRI